MSKKKVPLVIENALNKAFRTGEEVTLEIKEMRWSPRGVIATFELAEDLLEVIVQSNNQPRLYVFSASSVVGVGFEYHSNSHEKKVEFGWAFVEQARGMTPPVYACKHSASNNKIHNYKIMSCPCCGRLGPELNHWYHAKCPTCSSEMYVLGNALYSWKRS
jgi:hypothetical protein